MDYYACLRYFSITICAIFYCAILNWLLIEFLLLFLWWKLSMTLNFEFWITHVWVKYSQIISNHNFCFVKYKQSTKFLLNVQINLQTRFLIEIHKAIRRCFAIFVMIFMQKYFFLFSTHSWTWTWSTIATTNVAAVNVFIAQFQRCSSKLFYLNSAPTSSTKSTLQLRTIKLCAEYAWFYVFYFYLFFST